MADEIPLGLAAAIRALDEVVRPALDSADSAAVEQLQLTIRYLSYVACRADRLYERGLFELQDLLRCAEGVRHGAAPCSEGVRVLLDETVEAAAEVASAYPPPPLPVLQQAAKRLGHALRQVVMDAAQGPVNARAELDRWVVASARSRVLFERAWYGPLGLDPGADLLPSLDEIVAGDPG